MIAGIRLRAGRASSGKGAASMITQAIRAARAAGATGKLLVRGDSAYGSAPVIHTVLAQDAEFSLVLAKNPALRRAIDTIEGGDWTPVHYPGAVIDPDTGELICDTEEAEVTYTAFAGTRHAVTARLIVQRIRDAAEPLQLCLIRNAEWPVALTPSHLVLLDPVPQRARVDPEITRDHRDRFLGLPDDPDGSLTELRVKLPANLRHDYSS